MSSAIAHLNQLVEEVPRFLQILHPALVSPASDVLDDGALEIAEVVGGYVVPRLNLVLGVVGAAHLCRTGRHAVHQGAQTARGQRVAVNIAAKLSLLPVWALGRRHLMAVRAVLGRYSMSAFGGQPTALAHVGNGVAIRPAAREVRELARHKVCAVGLARNVTVHHSLSLKCVSSRCASSTVCTIRVMR